jgi:hypothetical protein
LAGDRERFGRLLIEAGRVAVHLDDVELGAQVAPRVLDKDELASLRIWRDEHERLGQGCDCRVSLDGVGQDADGRRSGPRGH